MSATVILGITANKHMRQFHPVVMADAAAEMFYLLLFELVSWEDIWSQKDNIQEGACPYSSVKRALAWAGRKLRIWSQCYPCILLMEQVEQKLGTGARTQNSS